MNHDYDRPVQKWLDAHNVTVKIEPAGTVFNPWGNEKHPQKHDQYSVTITRGKRSYSFTFTDSAANTANHGKPSDYYDIPTYRKARAQYKEPTPYDVLSCLTWYEPPNTLQGFIDDYGSSGNADKDLATWRAVTEEYNQIARLFTEAERAELAELAA